MSTEVNMEIAPGPTRLAWPLADLEEATGMSVAFWKKIIGKGEIVATKFGARTVILDEHLREWIKTRNVRGKANGHESKAA